MTMEKRMLPRTLLTLLLIPLLLQLGGCSTTSTTVAAGGGAAVVATDQRTVGTFIDDQMIELNVSDALYKDRELEEKTHINITSFNFIVLITGEAPTEALRSRIEKIVMAQPKVRRVHNMVTVAAPSSILTRTSDTTLTGRIKAAMLGAEDFKAHKIKVVTENGATYLMGLVSREEGKRAVAITQGISGVQKIVKLFEYTD